jgi:ferredoxin-NADP reductase
VESVLEPYLDQHLLTPQNATLYLCGNPEMIAAAEEIATRRGFPAEQVRKELYWPKGRTHAGVTEA